MMAYSTLIVEEQGPVAEVTLNRPEVRNAFDDQAIEEITRVFRDLAHRAPIRAILLTGAGEAFSAGADLDWMARMSQAPREQNLQDAMELEAALRAVAECPKATIAKVNGAAFGGGAGLVAACDVAVSATTAAIAFSEVRLGLAPAVIAPYVVRKIGYGAARRLFITGERISATEALRIGLVDHLATPEELNAVAWASVASVLKGGPNAIAATKRLLAEIDGRLPGDVRELTAAAIAELRASDEGTEGVRAFLEKRRARFAETRPQEPESPA
jgi:enoyl-CoA hydratase/carnithine racemase